MGPGRTGRCATCCSADRSASSASPDGGAADVAAGDDVVERAKAVALGLDDTVLPIQGPPGSGKTYTGARMIVELVRAGKRVGITATAHKVITNLVDAVVAAAARGAGRGPDDPEGIDRGRVAFHDRHAHATSPAKRCSGARRRHAPGGGGTSWLFARADMAGAARRPVRRRGRPDVAGRRRRDRRGGALDRPARRPEPAPAGLARAAIPTAPRHRRSSTSSGTRGPSRTTAACSSRRRGACTPTSATSSPRRSTRADSSRTRRTSRAATSGPGGAVEGTGIRFVPVAHDGNRARSREEADLVADAIRRPRRPAVDGPEGRDPRPRRSTTSWSSRRTTPRSRRSSGASAASSASLASAPSTSSRARRRRSRSTRWRPPRPRTRRAQMEFLYTGNRLNVAISRAQGVAVLVVQPRAAPRARATRRRRCASQRALPIRRDGSGADGAGLDDRATAIARPGDRSRRSSAEPLTLGL